MSNVFIIARAYARAIFDISLEQKSIDQWKLMLKLFVRISSYDLVKDLFFRFLEPEKLSNIFIAICEDFQKKQIDVLAKNFIRILSEKHQLFLLPMVLEQFIFLCSMHYTFTVKIEVISAWPLSKNQIRKIAFLMTKRLFKKVDVVNKINKDILAGIIIRTGDIIMDGSVNRRMLRLKNYILQS